MWLRDGGAWWVALSIENSSKRIISDNEGEPLIQKFGKINFIIKSQIEILISHKTQ